MEDAKLASLHSNLSTAESSRGFRGGLGKSVATLKTKRSEKNHLYLGNFVREGEGAYKNWAEDEKKKKETKKKVYGWIESEASQKRLDDATASGAYKPTKKRKRKRTSASDTEPSAEFISNKGKSLSWKKVCKKILKKEEGRCMKLKLLAKAMRKAGVDVKRKELKGLIEGASKFTIEKKVVSFKK